MYLQFQGDCDKKYLKFVVFKETSIMTNILRIKIS